MNTFNIYMAGFVVVCNAMALLRTLLSSEADAKELRSSWKWAAFAAFFASLCWYMTELDVRDHKLMEESCVTPTPK